MADDIDMSEAQRTGEAPRPRRVKKSLPRRALETLASIRITVALLVLSCVLVFLGTIAQIDNGVWTVMSDYFRSWVVEVPVRSLAQFVEVFFVQTPGLKESSYSFWFPAGYTLGFGLVINLLAAHAVRFKLGWNRVGILATHAGLLILLAGEFITGQLAVESRMVLSEGERASYVEANRLQELAVIRTVETPEGKRDEMTVVPHASIKDGNVVSDAQLPFDVRIVERYPNTRLLNARQLQAENESLLNDPKTADRVLQSAGQVATREGFQFELVKFPEGSGVDTNQREDAPSAKFEFLDKTTKEVIDTKLLSVYFAPTTTRRTMFFPDQIVKVDGIEYRVSFRPRRDYKSYAVELKKFTATYYPGTTRPKSFESDVVVYDENGNVARPDAKIWMNHPIRVEGDDLYQSEVLAEEAGGGTVLQVVRNPGSRMPYIACLVMTLGMIVQFGLSLYKFTGRKTTGGSSRADEMQAAPLTGVTRYLGYGLLLVIALFLIGQVVRPVKTIKGYSTAAGMDLEAFARLPVQSGGRIKPVDSVARQQLTQVSHRAEYSAKPIGEETPPMRPAVEWYLTLAASGDLRAKPASEWKIIRIEDPDILSPFDLKARPGSNRYSLAELEPNLQRFITEVNAAGRKADKDRNLYEKHLILLGQKLDVMGKVANRAETRCLPPSSRDPKSPTSEWMSPAEVDETVEARVAGELRAEMEAKGINLQNANQAQKTDLLRRFNEMTDEYRRSLSPAYGDYMAILNAFEAGDADRFNKAVEDFRDRHLGFVSKSAVFQAEVEAFLNKLAPFYWSIGFYTLAAVLAAVSWLPIPNPGTRRGLLRAALMLLAFTVMLHTGSLVLRIIVSGRPPVTNLYSSAVFIGWGAALLALLLEFVYRNGFSTAVGGVIGAMTMIISHHLSKEGDTLDVMQAVLDTNFWLATHVTCVTLGYAATYFAGFIGVGYIAARLINMGKLPHDTEKMFSKMLYGMVCFATLLSFVGTVLGGIWADESWGRFWGWDPKENGAVLIVLWNALILHARWGGLAKTLGLSQLAVFGNMIVTWSWFGTNQLGVGLHAYGFSNTLAKGCRAAWIAFAVCIVLGWGAKFMNRSQVMEPVIQSDASRKGRASTRK